MKRWEIRFSSQVDGQLEDYAKKKRLRGVFDAIMANLQKYQELLLPNKSIFAVDPGFLRKEPSGVVAISERGHGAGLPATRLYVYPDDSTKIIHVILIGNKNTQSVDIRRAIAFVEDLKTRHEHDQGQKENEA